MRNFGNCQYTYLFIKNINDIINILGKKKLKLLTRTYLLSLFKNSTIKKIKNPDIWKISLPKVKGSDQAKSVLVCI